ncbi:hypothetical protein BBJ29_006526 [Phytophthora kernoviae]|uniref:FYVE-type domain-containing protein n=1 Tax=Phytophthora kernoviae TaxID=325452 RepID=A0A3F2RFY7_9STRA|nr:hypothetical protein BBP00_00008232 [Phytophthora kernoviae]RLN68482.1 hypothetical protein BBJ29_006526 [Phytophthora kernoviae]
MSSTMTPNATELARRRESIMNPEAKHVLNVLTKSLRQFERVVRRRRFGFQTFIYFPTGYDDPSLEKSCSICSKRFHFFRRDFFCHLCGHMVCGECSQLYEVEVRAGELRRNRCCLQCVLRVDSCVFDDENLLEALGPAVVAVDDALWCNDDKFHLDAMDVDGDTASMTSDSSSVEELTEQLYSNDPSQHSHALEFLGQLVNPAAAQQEYEFVSPSAKSRSKRRKNATKVQQVAQDVENYLSQSLRVMKDRYSNLDQCTVADLEERDYVFDFDAKKTKAEDHPMPPMPAPKKEARRLEAIDQMGFYAGFPVHGPNGEVVASLCAADGVPHNNILTKDYATMEALAKLASDLVTPKNPAIC